MISINAKILLHYLEAQDSDLQIKATRCINQYSRGANSIFINNIVICQLTWHLEQKLYNRAAITSIIRALLATKEFAFENFELIKDILTQYEQGDCSFSDYLGNVANQTAKCVKNIAFT